MVRDSDAIMINGREFQAVKSRRPTYNEDTDGQKLHSKELMTKDNKPLRSAPMIMRFFNQLEQEGWTITKDAFVSKHWK